MLLALRGRGYLSEVVSEFGPKTGRSPHRCGFRRLSEIAVHLRKHPEFAACISTEAHLAVFTAGPRDSKAQKLALHKVFESFMVWSSVRNFKRPSIWDISLSE